MDSSNPEENVDVNNEETSKGNGGKRQKTKLPPKKEKGSKKKKTEHKERSPVWEHFTRLSNDDERSRCHYCKRDFACPTSSGTSNMNKHLLSCKAYEAFQKSSQTIIQNDGQNLKIGKVTDEVIREASNELIVLGELPLAFIESDAWKHFCKKVNLPNPQSRRNTARDIYKMFVNRKNAVKTWLAATKQRVSLTTDIWVAPSTCSSYMVITLHFIDSNWHLRKLIIGFKYITDHKGSTIASVLLECLEEWGIKKVFTITVDNATANTTALKLFQREFRLVGNDSLVLDGEFMHMRCAAHIINLIVKEGLKEVDANINAIRNAVQYVRSSTKRLNAFDLQVDTGKLSRGSLPLDCETRWNSTHLMLTKALQYKAAFSRMEAEDKLYNDYFQEVEKGKKRLGPPNRTDWQAVERLVNFLGMFYQSTLVVSASSNVCSYKCYGEIVGIEKNLMNMSNSLDKELRAKAVGMREKFDKYWDGLREINKLLIVATVFDPRKKMHYAQHCFEKIYGVDTVVSRHMYQATHDVLVALFKEYSSVYSKVSPGEYQSQETATFNSQGNAAENVVTEYENMDLSYNDVVAEKGLEEARDELEIYLKEKVEKTKHTLFADSFDVLSWWRCNSQKYPVLSEIARDILAMQVSSVASESAFSTSGRILEPSRSSLSHYSMEVLMCTEQWMKAEIQLKDKGAITNAELLADFELQDSLQKEFHDLTLQ